MQDLFPVSREMEGMEMVRQRVNISCFSVNFNPKESVFHFDIFWNGLSWAPTLTMLHIAYLDTISLERKELFSSFSQSASLASCMCLQHLHSWSCWRKGSFQVLILHCVLACYFTLNLQANAIRSLPVVDLFFFWAKSSANKDLVSWDFLKNVTFLFNKVLTVFEIPNSHLK